jgi:hypothetical protein
MNSLYNNNKILKSDNTEKETLEKLAKSNKSFWKVSQSRKGRSIEKFYTSYIEGEIVEAKTQDKLLSFVEEENLAMCFMYGDTLTKFDFSLENPKFIEIKDTEYHYIGGGLGEYEAAKLLVDKNYSLKDIDTIVFLIKIAKSNDLRILLNPKYRILGRAFLTQLQSYGYIKSLKFICWLHTKYDCDSIDGLNKMKDNIRSLAENFKKKYKIR